MLLGPIVDATRPSPNRCRADASEYPHKLGSVIPAPNARGSLPGPPVGRSPLQAQVLGMRNTIGNQAVLRFLSQPAPAIQTKLAINHPGDKYEQEADRVANQVMHMPDPVSAPRLGATSGAEGVLQRACACGGSGGECAACKEKREEGLLQRKATGAMVAEGTAPPVVHEALRSPSQPLDHATRSFFEPRFKRDFANVRLHTDATAAESANSIGALAYAAGRDIAFADGQYQPETVQGRRLIAHELAHVLQQDNSGSREVRRLGDTSQIPMMLSCPVATDAAPQATDFVLFPNNSSSLTAAQRTHIAEFVDNWTATGQGATVRVDGFASEPGSDALNWQLSCDRASTVKHELMNPSAGSGARIPESSIQLFMQGETSEFGSEALNRRVTLFLPGTTPVEPSMTPAPQQPPDTSNQQGTPEPPPTPEMSGTDLAAAAKCAHNSNCPDDYCKPFDTQQEGKDDRAANAPTVLSRIGSVNGKARPLFEKFVFNPGPAGDISGEFAKDFSADLTTTAMTLRIVKLLQDAFAVTPPTFPPGVDVVSVPIFPTLDQKTTNDLLDSEMVFDDPFTVPGLIAGGVGKTQESCKVGANTEGAVNDSRQVDGSVEVTKSPDGSLVLTPSLTFTVVDTLDFCPGNCGNIVARILTVPLSRWEASFISGDVPFTVTFAGASLIGAFDSEEE